MKERLTRLLYETAISNMPSEYIEEAIDHLIAKGVIVQPCKPGDTVYTVDKIRGVYELIEWRVVEISIDSHCGIVVLEHPHHGIKTRRGCDFEAFGVSAFLHKGKAIRAMQNRKTGMAHAAEVEK